jgi:6-pyruvoyl-tetrahydropterin synthase
MVMDLAELKRLVGETVVSRFDHADLCADPIFAQGVIPTLENIVRATWDLLAPKLGAERLHRLRLWEDPTLYVEYFGP